MPLKIGRCYGGELTVCSVDCMVSSVVVFFSSEGSQGELIVYQWSVVHRSSLTLSNLYISEASWPILIKFYV